MLSKEKQAALKELLADKRFKVRLGEELLLSQVNGAGLVEERAATVHDVVEAVREAAGLNDDPDLQLRPAA